MNRLCNPASIRREITDVYFDENDRLFVRLINGKVVEIDDYIFKNRPRRGCFKVKRVVEE